MNVGTATVCVNCDTVFEFSSACPGCGAVQQLVPLSRWIPAIRKPAPIIKKQGHKRTIMPKIMVGIFCGIAGEVACLLVMYL